jgi:hypothetical protein
MFSNDLEKPIAAQLFKKFPKITQSSMFLTMLTAVRHYILLQTARNSLL